VSLAILLDPIHALRTLPGPEDLLAPAQSFGQNLRGELLEFLFGEEQRGPRDRDLYELVLAHA